MELKTAWYFFAKRKDRKRKRTSHRLFIDTVINLSQPQLMHSEVACAFRGIGRAGPQTRSSAFPIHMEETDGNIRFYTVQQPLLELCVIPWFCKWQAFSISDLSALVNGLNWMAILSFNQCILPRVSMFHFLIFADSPFFQFWAKG